MTPQPGLVVAFPGVLSDRLHCTSCVDSGILGANHGGILKLDLQNQQKQIQIQIQTQHHLDMASQPDSANLSMSPIGSAITDGPLSFSSASVSSSLPSDAEALDDHSSVSTSVSASPSTTSSTTTTIANSSAVKSPELQTTTSQPAPAFTIASSLKLAPPETLPETEPTEQEAWKNTVAENPQPEIAHPGVVLDLDSTGLGSDVVHLPLSTDRLANLSTSVIASAAASVGSSPTFASVSSVATASAAASAAASAGTTLCTSSSSDIILPNSLLTSPSALNQQNNNNLLQVQVQVQVQETASKVQNRRYNEQDHESENNSHHLARDRDHDHDHDHDHLHTHIHDRNPDQTLDHTRTQTQHQVPEVEVHTHDFDLASNTSFFSSAVTTTPAQSQSQAQPQVQAQAQAQAQAKSLSHSRSQPQLYSRPQSPCPSPPPPLSPSPSSTVSPSHQTPASLPVRALRSFSSRASLKTTPPPPAITQSRKPSPGLAARLKALGFASSASKLVPSSAAASATAPVLIDRSNSGLVQHQARQLDQSHQAGSASTLIIERRGRPWKGTVKDISSAVANALHRKASFESTKSSTKSPSSPFDCASILLPSPTHQESFQDQALASPALISPNFLAPPLSPHSPSSFHTMLPEIDASQPFDMDTNKYMLPDHLNENSTKAELSLRQGHMDRMPPPPPLTLTPAESIAPPPPPKDTPPPLAPSASTSSIGSEYFASRHERAVSIYTLSRVSFANQLAQLTSLQLPDADSLSSKVAAIPTAYAANNALINAAEQIRGWIAKAAEVIDGLDSDDDVEWAAAGGREGLEEVEKAIVRFEELINIYVSAIEDMQCRPDISEVSPNDLNKAVIQMESILSEWMRIRNSLQSVKEQVEIAMEWQELWNSVLGDIQDEMDELSRLVFEMEERRHKSLMAANDGVDIGDLETIVEEVPTASRLQAQGRFVVPPMSPGSPGTPTLTLDDSSLLALFARMQPLRASLDFVPMRLSVFEMRAKPSFPTACDELEMRRAALDGSYKKLEKDAESLRKELGEDKWVDVFRNAGRQAQKMYESVHRSVDKLQDAIKAGSSAANQSVITKKIESYEAKKMHYGPAIERVLSIIDKGVKDRLTVNGEILRLHIETQTKWDELKKEMAEMDLVLEEVQSEFKSQQLRDSISSLLSSNNDRASTVGSSLGTPGSSPPDSVIMSMGSSSKASTSTAPFAKRTRASTAGSVPQNRRYSSVPPAANQTTTPRKANPDRLSVLATPTSRLSRSPSTADLRPKWNGSVNTRDLDTGHNFKPLTLTTPSPYAKRSPSATPGATQSSLSLSPGSTAKVSSMRQFSVSPRSSTASPAFDDLPPRNSSRMSFRDRINNAVTPGPYSQITIQKTRAMSQSASHPPSVSANGSSANVRDGRRSSLQPRMASNSSSMSDAGHGYIHGTAGSTAGSRPSSSLAFNPRRSSILPMASSVVARTRAESTDGRNSPQPRTSSRMSLRRGNDSKDNKPRWRF